MTSPQPDDVGLLGKLLAGVGTALAALSTWAWAHTHKRIDSKAEGAELKTLADKVEGHTISRAVFDEHAKADDKALAAINGELTTQRGHTAKLFDKLEELGDKTEVRFTVMEKAGFDRHVELLNAIHGISKK